MSDLVNTNPYEAWDDKMPSLSHFKVFGCDAFVHIPKERRRKLNRKSEKCIFIGYKDRVKGYKIWNPVTRIKVYSRDVIFKEDKITSKNEVVIIEKELEKLELNWKNETHGLDGSAKLEEEEVELQTLVIKRFG